MTSYAFTTDPFATKLADISTAVTEYERQRARLYDGGQPIYADHDAREAAALAPLDAIVARAEELADTTIREAEAAIDAEEHGDPTARLSAAELERANARAAFTKEDCDLLPMPALLARLKTALAGDDRAALYLLARYAGQRADRETQAGRAAGNGPAATSLHDLTAALREASGRFRDSKAKAAATARIAAARQFRKDVHERSGARERAVARTRAELRASGRYAQL